MAAVEGAAGVGFQEAATQLGAHLRALEPDQLAGLLDGCGLIPERFAPSSSAEKLYAKAMDLVVAECLCRLGLRAAAVSERGDAPDVVADADGFGIVVDAKSARASRSALNVKDPKLSAVDGWRGERAHALVVAPVAAYPFGRSRVYAEAMRFSVLLLNYTHLAVMVERKPGPEQVRQLFSFAATRAAYENDATSYWGPLDATFSGLLGMSERAWRERLSAHYEALGLLFTEQAEELLAEQEAVRSMTREQMEEILLAAGRKRLARVQARRRWASAQANRLRA